MVSGDFRAVCKKIADLNFYVVPRMSFQGISGHILQPAKLGEHFQKEDVGTNLVFRPQLVLIL